MTTLDRIDGTVLTIRYSKANFTVALFEQAGRGAVWVVGDLAAIEEGQRLSLYGRAATHPKHGQQFRVEYFHPYLEESRDGIRRFLAEEVDGIGPTFAERLVSYFYPKFGATMLEALQADPALLREVPGLGDTRRAAIEAALRETYGTRQVLTELYAAGISPAQARAVVKTYEERGIEPLRVFQETPYQMALDVPGLGWETVDRLARRRGVALEDAGRLQAATLHALTRAFHRDGHSFLTEGPLVQQVGALVWGDGQEPPPGFVDRLGDALEVLRRQRYVQIVPVRDDLAFYPRAAWVVEEQLATHLRRLLEAPIPPLAYFAKAPDAARAAAEARAGITLDAAQREAFLHAMERGVGVITGGPGTGKSTLARLIVDSWEEAGLRVKLCAPTGRAARRLAETTGRETATIHRLLEWREGEFQRHEEDPLEAGALLVDESSMVDGPLAAALCRAIPSGCRLLWMGDVDQLPSVGPGNVLHDLIASGLVPVARLDQIHRQDISRENFIVTLAHAVNRAPPGQPIPGGPTVARRPDEGNVFLFDTRQPWARCTCGGVRLPHHCPACKGGSVLASLPEPSRGAELIQQLVTERIPQTFGVASDDVQVIAPQYRGPLGVDELNERLRGALNPAKTTRPELHFGNRHFRLGDRVMAVRNNYEKDVVNGLQGRIVDVEPNAKRVMTQFDGEVTATFGGEELDDLTHAYAITAHKSQGGEFPVVLLALDPAAGRLLYRQLFYTAITRARHLLVLVGDPAALARATANDRPRHRNTGVAWWLHELPG